MIKDVMRMMRVAEGIETILEKLIIVNKDKKYNQIVFLAGGAGSGKDFSIKKFINANSYKVRDVDEWKRLFIKLDQLKGLYPEIRGLNLRNPEDVAKLHAFTDRLGTKEKTLDLLFTDLQSANKPNVMFNMTAKSVEALTGQAEQAVKAGYAPEDIHIIWVLANFKQAAARNKDRKRVVPDKVMLATHTGAARTMSAIIFDRKLDRATIDGEIYVILGNSENTVMYPTSSDKANPKADDTVRDFTYMKVKSSGKPIDLDVEKLARLTSWVQKNTPDEEDAVTEQFFSPRSHPDFMVVLTHDFGGGLRAVVTESEPYDCITYHLGGDPVASEFVADYKKRITAIKQDVSGFIEILRAYKD